MKVRWTTLFGLALVGFLALGLPTLAQAQGGPLLRLAADFKNFDFTESFTAAPVVAPDGTVVDGITVFKKSLFVPLGGTRCTSPSRPPATPMTGPPSG